MGQTSRLHVGAAVHSNLSNRSTFVDFPLLLHSFLDSNSHKSNKNNIYLEMSSIHYLYLLHSGQGHMKKNSSSCHLEKNRVNPDQITFPSQTHSPINDKTNHAYALLWQIRVQQSSQSKCFQSVRMPENTENPNSD